MFHTKKPLVLCSDVYENGRTKHLKTPLMVNSPSRYPFLTQNEFDNNYSHKKQESLPH